ncbi:hypothetical protein EV1_008318 [Malus domestica]
MAFGLSGWQSLPGLSLELGLSLGLPNAGACPPGNNPLFNPLSPQQMLPLELLLWKRGKLERNVKERERKN